MKRALSLLMALVLGLTMFTGCGSDTEAETAPPIEMTTIPTSMPTEPSISLEEYKKLAYLNLSLVFDSAVILNNTASYMNEYWKARENLGTSVSYQKLLEKANEYITENGIGTLELIEIEFDRNADLYKEVCFAKIDGPEADAIKESFEDFYDSYLSLYTAVMSPSGTREDFLDAYNGYVSDIMNSATKLQALLG